MLRWVVLLCLFVIAGCVAHEYKEVNRREGDIRPYYLRAGNFVRVVTNQEKSLEFKITEVSNTSLVGKDVEVAYEDIRSVQVRQVDEDKTMGIWGGSLFGILIIMAVAFAAVLGG